MEEQPIIVERLLEANVSTVWKAITDHREMAKWYFDLEAFEPKVGFAFEFRAGEPGKEYLHICKVTEVVPERKLSYSWRFDQDPGMSLVSFALFRQKDQTLIILTHSGVGSFDASNPALARTQFVKGWEQIIGINLKGYLEDQKK